jgi:hypothetical protein
MHDQVVAGDPEGSGGGTEAPRRSGYGADICAGIWSDMGFGP